MVAFHLIVKIASINGSNNSHLGKKNLIAFAIWFFFSNFATK